MTPILVHTKKKNTADDVLDSVKQDGTADIEKIFVITIRGGRAHWNFDGNMSTSDMVYLLERVKHAILNK